MFLFLRLFRLNPFLTDFGLKDLQELPALDEFAELRERYERNLSQPPASPQADAPSPPSKTAAGSSKKDS